MKKTVFFTFLILVALGFLSEPASAQQSGGPQIFMTWRTNTYVPPDYPGKALPTIRSSVRVSMNVVNKGQIADLSKQVVYWYVDNDLVSNTRGAQSVSVTMLDTPGSVRTVRVEVPNYPGGPLIKSIDVPTVRPEVVIETVQNPASELHFKARPFYFNTQDPSSLAYSWLVNGKEPGGTKNPDELVVMLSKETPLASEMVAWVKVSNRGSTVEVATNSATVSNTQ